MIPILIITGCQAAYLHPSLWRAVLDPLRAWVRSNQLLATRPLRAPMSSRWKHADICLREKKLKKTGSFSAKKHCTKDRMKTGNRLAKIPKPLVKLSLLVFSWLVFQRIFFFFVLQSQISQEAFHTSGLFFELPTQHSSLPSTFSAMLPSKHAAQAKLQSWHASNPEPSRWFPKFWWKMLKPKWIPRHEAQWISSA